MRGTFTLDGKSCSDFGIYINGNQTYNAAKKIYNFYNVPHRNGAIIGANSHFDNVDLVYKCGIGENVNWDTALADLRNYLLSRKGYVRLEDSYNTDEYRMVCYEGPFEADVNANLTAAEFDIEFNAMPQRWLKSGETAVSVGSSQVVLSNPTLQAARPLIRLYGKSSSVNDYFTVGPTGSNGWQIFVDSSYTGASIYIDCESMECYRISGTTKVKSNQYVDIRRYSSSTVNSATDFPVLAAGNSYLDIHGTGITAAEIVPRWWRL